MLYELGLVNLVDKIVFRAKGGRLVISQQGELISMDFPSYPFERTKISADFKNIVGFDPTEMYSTSSGWVMAVASSEAEIIKAKPDFGTMVEKGLGLLMITAKGNDVDFVVRCFAPSSGIDEDPVTGSAQCGLVPLWNYKTGKTHFKVTQLSKRTGQLDVTLEKDRVVIKGRAVIVFKADLRI